MTGVYACPKCGKPLERTGNSLVCPEKHCYDISASGYVNLLLSEQMNAKLPGDNKLMVNARRAFLDKGYYSNLMEVLCETAAGYFDGGTIFDAGCGDGYYTFNVYTALSKCGGDFFLGGTDISKNAVNAAAKRFKSCRGNTLLSVSSVFHLPIESGSCSLLTTLFAPYCGEEYHRVLKKGGVMIMVIPSERHLWGLKKAVYETPYLNQVKAFALEGFALDRHIHLENEISLPCAEDIQNLFKMTPYYYKTGAAEQAKLNALTALTTETGFEVLAYKAE